MFTFAGGIMAGCDKFLEENPDNRVELNNTDKAAQLLTNAYSNAAYTFTEWMTDNVSYTFGTTKLPEHDQAYTWSEFTGIDQDTPSQFWTSTYDAIAHSNEVLAVIDDITGDRAHKQAVKGEALLRRPSTQTGSKGRSAAHPRVWPFYAREPVRQTLRSCDGKQRSGYPLRT
jgi:hypothetical protein